jgi:hypothetical protein
MKKIIVYLLLLAPIGRLHAQSFNFGVTGGLNESSIYRMSYYGNHFQDLTGFNAGAVADYNRDKLTIESGLYYTNKGYYSNTNLIITDISEGKPATVYTFHATGKVVLHYLEVPFNVLYNFPLPVGKLFVGGGPYLDYALSGQINGASMYTASNGPGASSTSNDAGSADFGSAPGEFKKIYVGANAVTGLRLKNGFFIDLKFGYAFENITNNEPRAVDNGLFRYYGYSFSGGYTFL